MALTPGTLAGFLTAFYTYVDAENWAAAEAELLKAEVELQSIPNTSDDNQSVSWRGTLDSAWKMLQQLRDRDQATAGILVHSAHRRKERSQRSDGT